MVLKVMNRKFQFFVKIVGQKSRSIYYDFLYDGKLCFHAPPRIFDPSENCFISGQVTTLQIQNLFPPVSI